MIDLIIFDLDGVLIDTEDTHYTSLCDSINTVTGIEHRRIMEIIKSDGSTTKSKLKVLQSVFGFSDETCFDINRLKQESVVKVFAKAPRNERQLEMLSELSKNYKLAIGSNSRKTSVDVIVDTLGIRGFFDHIISIDDINIEKPNPAIFNRIMEVLDVPAYRTVILEDSPRGIEAAKNSGAHFLITTFALTTLENIENAIRKIETYNNSTNGRFGDKIC